MSGDTDYLRLLGDFAPTLAGDELKGWIYDEDSAGRVKCYLPGGCGAVPCRGRCAPPRRVP